MADRLALTSAAVLAAMTRTAHLVAVACAAGAAVLALAVGAGLGYGWGRASAAAAYAATDAAVRYVAHEEGPAAAADWRRLMLANPIEPLLAGCRGAAVAVDGAGTGCHLWLRIGAR